MPKAGDTFIYKHEGTFYHAIGQDAQGRLVLVFRPGQQAGSWVGLQWNVGNYDTGAWHVVGDDHAAHAEDFTGKDEDDDPEDD